VNRFLNRFWPALFALISLILAFFMILGSQIVGVANDEHIHMLDLGDWRWASDPELKHFGVYGLSFQLLGHAVAVSLGIEQLGVIGFAWPSFAVRHAITATLAILTALAASLTVFLILRRYLWAFWSVAALLTMPVFFGHGMFNPKDVPVAFGYALLTLGCVSILVLLSQERTPGFWRSAAVVLCIAMALWIAVGTRYGMVFPFLLTISLLVVILLIYAVIYRPLLHRVLLMFGLLVSSVAFGFLALFLTNPCIVAPISSKCQVGVEILPVIFERSSQYQDRIPTFIAGVIPDVNDPNFWSLPLSLFVGASALVWFLAFVGLVFFPENWNCKGREVGAYIGKMRLFFLAAVFFVACQAFLIPAFVVVMRSTWYDLQRQHLYFYPALAILAALGLALLWQKAKSAVRWGFLQKASVMSLAISALVLPGIDIAKLWPYSYVYVNEVSMVTGFSGTWELDYTFLSDREALAYVPSDAFFRTVGAYWKLKPLLHERGLRTPPEGKELTSDLENLEYVVYSNRISLGQTGLPSDCQVVGEVKRNFRGEELVLSSTGLCPKNSGLGVSFDDLIAHDP
jgi:hypothetical protein